MAGLDIGFGRPRQASYEAGTCTAPTRDNGNGRTVRNLLEVSYRRMARRVLDLYTRTTRHPHAPRAAIATLTERERTVLGLVGAGLSNAEIGRELHLTEGTIKTHVSAILDRLGARNRVQAAIIAHEHHLIPE